MPRKRKKVKEPPMIENYVARIIKRSSTVEPYDKILRECGRLLPFLDDLDKRLAAKLADALEAMLKRSSAHVKSLASALKRYRRPPCARDRSPSNR